MNVPDDAQLAWRDPAAVQLDPRNARVHSDSQLRLVRGLIQQFGFRSAILVDEAGMLIAGEARVLAARELGLKQVPALICTGLSAEARAALALADNRAPLDAEWDLDVLGSTMRWLEGTGFDVFAIGFSQDEVRSLLDVDGAGGERPDVVPERPAVPVAKLGDVWVCGPHRVVCGDATDDVAYESLLGKERVDLCWTDPPYNVDYDGKAFVRGGEERKIKGDDQSTAKFAEMLSLSFKRCYGAMKVGASIYVAHSEMERGTFTVTLGDAGFKLSGAVIWQKNSLVLGRKDYQQMHEPILYGWKPGARHRWYGGRKQTTIADLGGEVFQQQDDGSWAVRIGERVFRVEGAAKVEELEPSVVKIPKPHKSPDHPTMKPTALIERQLRNSGRPGDLVLDPFGGSGSTLIAADRMGMSARLIELDPRYVDVIVRRWEQFTGREAQLAEDVERAA